MLRRLVGTRMLLMGALCWSAGCMSPVYRNPAGFSSTYHKHVYGPQRYAQRPQQPPLPPPPADGVFFPSSVQYDPHGLERIQPLEKKLPKRIVLDTDPPNSRGARRR